jgi:DNA repair protein RadC
MFALLVQNEADRPLTHLRGKLVRCLAHRRPFLSGVRASGNPGAVQLICVFADLEGFIIGEEILADGIEGLVTLSSRRIFRRALNLNARSLVLAHNHPSGCARPSDADIRDTCLLAEQARGLGIVVEDHFVVGRKEVVSMKRGGLF